MFAYNPTVNNNSGQILGNYTASAANTRAEGMQSFGKSIGEGIAAMSSGIAGGMTKAHENAIKYNEAAGMLDAYRSNAESLGLSLDMLNGIEEKYSKDPDKLLGHLTVLGSIANNNLSMQRAQAQIDGYKDLYDYKAATGSDTGTASAPRMNSESIRSMVAEAKQAGFTDDAIKTKLQQQYGDWAVRSVYPPQNQGIWMGQ